MSGSTFPRSIPPRTSSTDATDLPTDRLDESTGARLHSLVTELFPICRSITGAGVRQTLSLLAERIPLQIHEVPSGTAVFDWQVPAEWNIRDAYIKDASGIRVVDFRQSNLHVVSYSQPLDARLTWEELRPHLFSLPERPEWIPYRTSYYHPTWGFCLAHRTLMELERRGPHESYEVRIDSQLAEGSLTYGETVLPGESTDEILWSCHICHPSLANDNLAAISLAVELIDYLRNRPSRRWTHRFLFVPGTIGAIAWLSLHRAQWARIKGGLVMTLLGNAAPFTYKMSRDEDTLTDRLVPSALRSLGVEHCLAPFSPYGYDERQYGSPGIRLPMGCLMRSPHAGYPEYHTSADNLQLVTPASLAQSWRVCQKIADVWEAHRYFENLNPHCEPQLGRRGLYQAIGGDSQQNLLQQAFLWVLSYADGVHALWEIADRAQLPLDILCRAVQILCEHGLLQERKDL